MVKLEREIKGMFFRHEFRKVSFYFEESVAYLTEGTVRIQIIAPSHYEFLVRATLEYEGSENAKSSVMIQKSVMLQEEKADTPKKAFRAFEQMMKEYDSPFEKKIIV